MLECVVNVSEGRRPEVIEAVGAAAGAALLDVHSDVSHHRSVFTLAGTDVEDATRALAREAVARIDLRAHEGVHPRLGVVDVVPFVPLDDDDAVGARDRFAAWAAAELDVPCFLYGSERSLPEVRRRAFVDLVPDVGASVPHPTAGAVAVGARPVLVAYNLWLASADVAVARAIARSLRSEHVRALGLDVDGQAQVSCNLIAPLVVGPDVVYDAVAATTEVARAELVGLAPHAVVDAIPRHRWPELDLDSSRTIEARLEQAGLDGGRFS
ncbi:MAG TPA: hypothetical protein VM938_00235 [Acidimicrobiales bacterium]|nr:hypothetical protein [Acidimicrobiales bacterium]